MSTLRFNTTGRSNTAVGNVALNANTTGYGNTAIGDNTLSFNSLGKNNTAIGYTALRVNTTGNAQVAIGYQSLYVSNFGSTSINANVAVGYKSLRNNTSGNSNTAIGNNALYCNITGTRNSAVGICALRSNTTGASNTAVGFCAQQALATGVDNTIAIGCNSATSATTGHTVWGNSLNNVCNCIYAAWSTVSDLRDKTNIKTLSSKFGLALINKLRPVAFNWDHRDTYVRECSYEYREKDGTLVSTKAHYGLIGQEFKSAIDELDVRFDVLGHDDDKDAYRLTYEELIAPIIKAIQELDNRLIVVEEKVG
jgi:hypothetical protein